jgi:hypothetical protein
VAWQVQSGDRQDYYGLSSSLDSPERRTIVEAMADHRSADIRNFAIVGHASFGKTILSEAMLACSGANIQDVGHPRS